MLDDRRGDLRGAAPRRRRACPTASRTVGIEPGDVVILLGRHSIEAAVAMLGCLHRGVVLAPLPPMFNAQQLAALDRRRRRASAIVSFGGEKEIAKCRDGRRRSPAAADGAAGGRRRS